MFRVHLVVLKYPLTAVDWVDTDSVSLSQTWGPSCGTYVTHVCFSGHASTTCWCPVPQTGGFTGRGLVIVHRFHRRWIPCSPKETRKPCYHRFHHHGNASHPNPNVHFPPIVWGEGLSVHQRQAFVGPLLQWFVNLSPVPLCPTR